MLLETVHFVVSFVFLFAPILLLPSNYDLMTQPYAYNFEVILEK